MIYYVVPVTQQGNGHYDNFLVEDMDGNVYVSPLKTASVENVDYVYGYEFPRGEQKIVKVGFTYDELKSLDSRYLSLARELPSDYRVAEWSETKHNDYYKVVLVNNDEYESIMTKYNDVFINFKQIDENDEPVDYVFKGKTQYLFTMEEINNINPKLEKFAEKVDNPTIYKPKDE